MHLIIFSHSYPGNFERLKEELDKRGYIDETTEEKIRYPAVWREVKLWDVLLPEGCKDDFLGDISCFSPSEGYLKAHTKGVSRILRFARRILRLFGIKSVDATIGNRERFPGRNVNGVPSWTWLIPVANLDELRSKEGKELW